MTEMSEREGENGGRANEESEGGERRKWDEREVTIRSLGAARTIRT